MAGDSTPRGWTPQQARLTPDDLWLPCDPTRLGFEDTREVPPLEGPAGQPRALEALATGLALPGAHIFLAGLPGTGRRLAVRSLVAPHAAAQPPPADWIYIYNFDEPRRPRALSLPAGQAQPLAQATLAALAGGDPWEELARLWGGCPPLAEHLRQVLARRPPPEHCRLHPFVCQTGPGAPLIWEDRPSLSRLFGGQAYRLQEGSASLDHTLLRPGSLHRANGGYLVLETADLEIHPGSWEALRRALRSGRAGVPPAAANPPLEILEPEEIPLELKVVLIGTPQAYDRFSHDEEFARLFSVLCDFDEEMPRTPETERLYARLVASLGTPPFEAGAVARLVEFGAREVEDRHKLSAILGDVTRLAQEAALEAGRQGAARVARGHVEEALRARRRRASLHEEKLMEAVLTGTVRIDTEGRAVGQVNSISVVDMPDYSFGRPGRVTARVSLGKEGIVDIEREAQNAGEMHSKGVLILGGFLAGRYAERAPLSVSISLCFEQLYEQVDGDSASSTELYAILSAIARVPMRQGIAVTGAVDQMGNVQPVGGVNEKIEGFFDLCYRRGLTGEQGVLLPRGNLRNLMLKEELVRAVAAGLFHLWAIGHIDEGLEILSDLPAGRRGRRGRYPRGTFNYLVQRNLERMAGDLRLFQHWEPPE